MALGAGTRGAIPFIDPTTPEPGESLLGLIARAVARNHIGSIRQALMLNGLPHVPANIVQSDAIVAGSLAEMVGCDADEISSRMVTRSVVHSRRNSKQGTVLVNWGDGQWPLRELEVKYRLICPTRLGRTGFHREAWMVRYLPYCPISYERLVGDCWDCGALQGWGSTKGLGNCEGCGKKLEPSDDAALPQKLRDDYGIISALSSRNLNTAAAAKSSLPAVLQGETANDLVNLAFVLGRFMVFGGHELNGKKAANNDKAFLTRALCAGARVMTNWPEGFKTHLEVTFDEHVEALGGVPEMCARLVNRQMAGAGPASIIKRDFPELADNSRKTPSAFTRETMAIGTFLRRAKLNGQQFATLKTGNTFKDLEVTGTSRTSIQLFSDLAEPIIDAKVNSTPIETVAHRMGLPVYAIEQLVARGDLSIRQHRIFDDLGMSCRICDDSVTALCDRLERLKSPQAGEAGPKFQRLGNVMKRFAGEKPWGHAICALLNGTAPFRIAAPIDRMLSKLPRMVIVETDALLNQLSLAAIRGDQVDQKLIDRFNQMDVMEVLGLDHARLKKAEEADVLIKVGSRRQASLYERAGVLSIAERFAGSGEVAHKLGEPFSTGTQFAKLLRDAGLKEQAGGWLRSDLPS